MAISYNWVINPLVCYPTSSQGPDYVFMAHWQLQASEEAEGTVYSASLADTQSIPMSTGSFIPFENLTLEIVQGWVENSMGTTQVENLKNILAQNINNQINHIPPPPVIPPMDILQSPWL